MHNRDTAYKQLWNHLKHVIKKEIDEWIYSKYQNYVKDLDHKDQSLWKATQRILGKYEKVPSLIANDGFITNDADKAETMKLLLIILRKLSPTMNMKVVCIQKMMISKNI